MPLQQPISSNDTTTRTFDAPTDQRIESARKGWKMIGSVDFSQKAAAYCKLGSIEVKRVVSPTDKIESIVLASESLSRKMTHDLLAADDCGIGRSQPIVVSSSDNRADTTSKSLDSSVKQVEVRSGCGEIVLAVNDTMSEQDVEEPLSGTVVVKE